MFADIIHSSVSPIMHVSPYVRTTPPILTNSNHDLKCVFSKKEEKCETHKCKLIKTKVSSKKWLPDPKTKLYRWRTIKVDKFICNPKKDAPVELNFANTRLGRQMAPSITGWDDMNYDDVQRRGLAIQRTDKQQRPSVSKSSDEMAGD